MTTSDNDTAQLIGDNEAGQLTGDNDTGQLIWWFHQEIVGYKLSPTA